MKKWLIVVTVSLSIMGCLTTEESLRQKYIIEADQYDEAEVNAYVQAIDKKFKTPGFKGLHFGMNYDDINDLVAKTPWGYKHFVLYKKAAYDTNAMNYPQYEWMNTLSPDRSLEGLTSWNTESSKNGRVTWSEAYIQAQLSQPEVIESITVKSGEVTADMLRASLSGWIKNAYRYLCDIYGPPTERYSGSRNLNVIEVYDGYTHSKWEVGDYIIRLGVSEYEFKYYGYIDMSTNDLYQRRLGNAKD